MKSMAQAEGDDMFVSTAAVGSIVGLQSAEIQQMASEYAEKSADLAAGRKPDKVQGAQAHQRRVTALQKQIAGGEKKVQEVGLYKTFPQFNPSYIDYFSSRFRRDMMSCWLNTMKHRLNWKR